MKYESEADIVWAIQYDGTPKSAIEISQWLGCFVSQKQDDLLIHSPDFGVICIPAGHWIHQDWKGRIYSLGRTPIEEEKPSVGDYMADW